MSTNDHQPRQPKGRPIGGQYAAKSNPESDIDLGGGQLSPLTTLVERRKDDLRWSGFLPFSAEPNVVSPRSTAFRREWWEQHFATAGYEEPGGGYPQMPDDWTPHRHRGRSVAGRHRTHRMCYTGSEVRLRMPSVAAVRSYEQATDPPKRPGGTFDVPVSATFPGGEVSGWVRVIRDKDGGWATQGLGFSKAQSAYVAEAVQCVLEARHPTMALAQAGDILERRRMRAAQIGAAAERIRSKWLNAAAYEPATKTMVVVAGEETGNRRTYGFASDTAAFLAMVRSPAPGRVFNQQVRGRATRVAVNECSQCGRFTAEGVSHRCPPVPSERLTTIPGNERVRRYIFGGEEA